MLASISMLRLSYGTQGGLFCGCDGLNNQSHNKHAVRNIFKNILVSMHFTKWLAQMAHGSGYQAPTWCNLNQMGHMQLNNVSDCPGDCR